MINFHWRKRRATLVVAPLTALSLIAALPFGANSFAAGGTAKPPPGAVAPFVTATLADPVITVNPATIHGFDDTGFIQSATVDTTNANCPNTTDAHRFGGTLTLNHGPIMIPCNLVIQAPANTFTWADFVNGPGLSLGTGYPSFEMRAVGNVVGARRIAGLLYASQQSLNTSTGVITGIDYATGNLLVDTGSSATPAIVQINDPNGRFGRAQSPDPRFSVDDANPTVHAGTGYPMCVPRTDPATADDALCPQQNRPKPSVTGQCRNFSVSGIAPPVSGELSPAAPGQVYCSEFVMNTVAARTATDPDPRQQAPFEIGDSITFSGTLIPATATAPAYTSAHTVEANIGIFTMPGTQPSYLAIGQFGVGTADPNRLSINGFAVETQDRIFLESETTDVKTPVDIYMQDVNPVTGAVRNRWVTPFAMTGEQNGPLQADGVTPIGGGITTQNSGPQPQRARLRATKAPVGLLSQPTRTIRVAVRSLCVPQAPVNDAAGNPVLTALDTCLNKNNPTNQVANGLEAGQYFAPTFEFIFPENVKPGDLLVPFDFWHLPFLRYGEGATTQSAIGPAVGPLEPTPWGGPSATIPGAPTIGAATAGDAAATVTWTPPAFGGGAPITAYSVNALDGSGALVGTVTVAGNVTTATVTGLANGTAVTLQVVATNLVGTGPASAPSNVVTPAAAAPAASAVALNPASVTGGSASTGTVTLTSAAPAGGAVVSLASSATAATVPASVTVPAGATSATFSIGTASVTASTPATIAATYGGATVSATLTVTSTTVTSTSLSAVSVNPTTVTGGTASQGTVLLTAAAPAGGSTVGLTSSSAAVTVPANVTVAAGALIATFPIATSAVTASTSATITASAGGVTQTAALTVTPVTAATLTVTATGRTGETVSSTPTGISVAVGSTGTASFPANTSITLRATNNRSVVWTGACSSNGAKLATCTFTITANASVTANVQ